MPKQLSDYFLQTFIPVQKVANCEYILAHQAVHFFSFWEEFEKEIEMPCIPFWGAVWPGARSLAKYVQYNPDLVQGKRVLDFGCGSGIVSIAAALSGASQVIANDIDPYALCIAKKNFSLNSTDVTVEPANLLNSSIDRSFDIIFVVDMFYERTVSVELVKFLVDQKKRGAKIILSDGGRPFVPKENLQLLFEERLEVDAELEGVKYRDVRILQMI